MKIRASPTRFLNADELRGMLRSTPIFRGCKSLLGKARLCRAHSLAAEGSAGVPAIIIWCRIGREEERERAERHKTIYFVATEHGRAGAAQRAGAKRAAQGFGQGRQWPVFFGTVRTQQNKNFVAFGIDL